MDNKVNVAQISEPETRKKARPSFRAALRRKSWKELSVSQKVTNVAVAIMESMLTMWALWDIKQRPEDQINGKKRTWVMTSLIQPFGPAIYLIFGRKRAAQHIAA